MAIDAMDEDALLQQALALSMQVGVQMCFSIGSRELSQTCGPRAVLTAKP